MEFGWINLIGGAIVALILIPNIIYAVRNKESDEHKHNKAMLIAEQLGRYSCIVFMWMPLFVWEFGFKGIWEMLLYVVGNSMLLILYYVFWIFYFKKRKKFTALMLAILPTCIFMLSGLLLRHWILVISSVLFGIVHIYITVESSSSL